MDEAGISDRTTNTKSWEVPTHVYYRVDR